MAEQLPHGDKAHITDVARRIVVGDLLVADLERSEWQSSLALMIEAIAAKENTGLILVPIAPHRNIYWINNVAPGCTFSVELVAREDIEALDAEVTRLREALYG